MQEHALARVHTNAITTELDGAVSVLQEIGRQLDAGGGLLHLPSTKRRLRPYGLKPRKKETTPGEWASQLNGTSICSYPPEDLVIEDYGRFIKRKAKSMLSEERTRTEPFTTSILDGIDLRETIRNWHERKIYVRQLDRIRAEVLLVAPRVGDREATARRIAGNVRAELGDQAAVDVRFVEAIDPGPTGKRKSVVRK